MEQEFDKLFNNEARKEFAREDSDTETRELIINIGDKKYLVRRENIIQVGSDGSRSVRATTVTEKCDGYDIVIMPNSPEFHAAKNASAQILYGRGGNRPGAGRPRVDEPRKTRGFRLTDAEYVKVKKFIDTIR